MRLLPKGAWGEHGAWAMALTSLGAGLVLAWPPVLASWLLLPSVVLVTAAKGMAQRARRTGDGYGLLAVFSCAGALFALPAVVVAPLPFLAAGAIVAPFGALYAWYADSPRFTRSLPVELLGTCLVAAGGPLALAATHPAALSDVALTGMALATLFLPGVFRARVRKEPTPWLRSVTAATAVAGLASWCAMAGYGLMAPWGLAAATVFLGDLWSVAALPQWRVKTLGIFFTLRYAAAALLMAFAWRPIH
jgi:hypothetical protein